MKFARTVFVGALLVAGVAFAKGDATDPSAKMREDQMKMVAMNTGILGDMAGGKTAFDAAAAEAAKAALIAAADGIPVAFETQGGEDATSEAKAEIWTSWETFITKAGALKAAAEGVDTSSLDGIKVGMGAVGGACKDCHTTFRE
jgi:cytochrome c556